MTRTKRALALGALVIALTAGTSYATSAQAATGRTTVRAALTHSAITRGSSSAVTGSVSPNLRGQIVILQRYYSGAWHNVARARLSTTSRYGFRVTGLGGNYAYRVYHPVQRGWHSSVSATVRLTVRVPATAVPSPSVPGPCGGARIAKPGGGYWTCSFADEFNATSLDTSKWWAMDTRTMGFRSGDECYNPANVSVANGTLNLTATKAAQSLDCKGFATPYESGMISSKGRYSQTYGRFEMRAKFPAGVGFQPAFWMLPENPMHTDGYYYGEIDVVEAWGNYPGIVSPHLHYVYTPGTTIGGAYCSLPTSTSAFHTYTVEWTTTRMTFSYDGKTCWSTGWLPGTPYAPAGASAPAPFNQPFYLMVELAMGGNSTATNRATTATSFPSALQVDYVRAWK